MTSPILFRSSEPSDWMPPPNFTTSGSGTYYRAGYSRCYLTFSAKLTPVYPFNSSDFWTHFWYTRNSNGSSGGPNDECIWSDSSGVARLTLRQTTSGDLYENYNVYKIDASGTRTLLGTTSSSWAGYQSLQQIDIHIVYSTTGSINIYQNGLNVFSYSGDVTTNGLTSLSEFSANNHSFTTSQNCFSEIIVATRDTRKLSLAVVAPVANGNTHAFDSGGASAVNAIDPSTNYAAPNYSQTAGQLQQYTIGSLPSGAFSVVDFTLCAIATVGATSAQHLDLNVRVASGDFLSPDLQPGAYWGMVYYTWAVNPNSSAVWVTADFGGGFNIGMKSVA